MVKCALEVADGDVLFERTNLNTVHSSHESNSKESLSTCDVVYIRLRILKKSSLHVKKIAIALKSFYVLLEPVLYISWRLSRHFSCRLIIDPSSFGRNQVLVHCLCVSLKAPNYGWDFPLNLESTLAGNKA